MLRTQYVVLRASYGVLRGSAQDSVRRGYDYCEGLPVHAVHTGGETADGKLAFLPSGVQSVQAV